MASSCAKPQNNNIKNNNEKHRGMYGKDYKWISPLIPMSDQDRISPYNTNTISSRQVMSQ